MLFRSTIKYETVKYFSGAIGGSRPDTNVEGFVDPGYYDTVPSALARPGSTQTVLGQGGLIDVGVGIAEDLASNSVAGVIGAAQKALYAYDTYKGKDLASIANKDVQVSAKAIAKGALPAAQRAVIGTAGQRGILDGIFFPTPPKATQQTPLEIAKGTVQGIGGEIARTR